MRVILVAAAMAASASAAAEPRGEDFQAAALHIGTAWHCQALTGDMARYEQAIALSIRRILAAGHDNSEAEAWVTHIISQLGPPQPGVVSQQTCAMLLGALEASAP
jgi:hypothetical protein